MKTFFRNTTSRLMALLAACALALAQGGAQAQPAYSFSQQELDRMLAPIALYPDALLSQILMAATYPLEVVEAARWARARPDLSGDAAVRAAEAENWDPSVKSLLAFPQVLARMGENLQWTQALGDAFLEQQSQVMDTVQALRRKAQAAGNLRSDERVSMVESGPSLLVQPFDSQVVYVPYYDPQVVYGTWWWPAYPPMYLRPWPGYYARPAYAGGFYWGPPVGISAGFFFGAIDWRQRQVRVVQVNNTYYNNLTTVRQANVSPQVSANRSAIWHHDPDHRRGLAYRSVDARQRFGAASAPPDRGHQARVANARRPDRGMEARPEARFEARRAEVRTGADTRPNPQPVQPFHTEIRIKGRRPDARPEVHTGVLAARDTAPARPLNTNPAESRQEARAASTAAEVRGGRAVWTETRVEPGQVSGHSGEARIRPERHANPQAARIEPSARVEVPRAPQPRLEARPAPSAARQESATVAVARHEPAARHQVPQGSAPRAEIRPPQAAARQESGAKVIARPRMGP